MGEEEDKAKTFSMKTEYWDVSISKGDSSVVKIELEFKDKVIPQGEIRRLEESIRKILEACGRLETLQPSKRQ